MRQTSKYIVIMNKYLFLLLFIILSSCQYDIVDEREIIRFESPANLDSLISEFKLVELELNDSSCFTSLTQFVDINSDYLIFDEVINKLFLFDSSGNFLSNVLSKGQSSTEYSHIESVCYYDSLLYVSDSRNKTIVVDIAKGLVLPSLPYFGHQIFKDSDSSFLSLDFVSEEDTNYYVNRYNNNGIKMSSFCPMTVNSGYMMSPKPYFYCIQDSVKFGLPFSDKLFHYCSDSCYELQKFIIDGYKFPQSSEMQQYCDENTIINFWRTDDKFVHLFIPYENSTHLIGYFRNAKNKWFGIYDKRTGKSLVYLIDVKSSLFYPIVGISNDYFVSNPSTEILNYLNEQGSLTINSPIDIDNSYLLFWKLK